MPEGGVSFSDCCLRLCYAYQFCKGLCGYSIPIHSNIFCHVPLCSILFYSIPFIPFHSILFYATLIYYILCYSILFYSILCYYLPFYSILFYSIIVYTIPFYSNLFDPNSSYHVISNLLHSIPFTSIPLCLFFLFYSFPFTSVLFYPIPVYSAQFNALLLHSIPII